MITIYSLIPSMKDRSGHSYEYNNIFTKASQINGWKHIKIVPTICELNEKDEDWQKLIFALDQKNKIKNFRNFFPFLKIFKKLNKDRNSVLFLEDFTVVVLFLCFLCIFLLRPKMKLWLLFRYEHDVMIKKGKVCRYLLFLFEFFLGSKNIKYLTDSELIAKKNEKFFQKNFEILPIAHTNIFSKKLKITKDKKILFWWPGVIREEKGFFRIQKLIEFLKKSRKKNVVLELSESARNKISWCDKINFHENHLRRSEYDKKMIDADLILLPYDEKSYGYRTSGIFVEAIVCNSITAVTKNTWMAKELIRYGLQDLVVNWDGPDLLQNLLMLCNDKKIKEKLLVMKRDYVKFHNVDNLAKTLKKISD